MTRRIITITVSINNRRKTIETYNGEYKNLMELLKDKLYFDSFGECGGMGRCATCIIRISGLRGTAVSKERNEPATLSKFGFEEMDIRLSCQIMVSADLDGAIITMLE